MLQKAVKDTLSVLQNIWNICRVFTDCILDSLISIDAARLADFKALAALQNI